MSVSFAITAQIEAMSNKELVDYSATYFTGKLPFEAEGLLLELLRRVDPTWSTESRPVPPQLPMVYALARLCTAAQFYETFGPANIGMAVKEQVSRDALTSLIEKALALGKLLQKEVPK